jgi:hypothetical protein
MDLYNDMLTDWYLDVSKNAGSTPYKNGYILREKWWYTGGFGAYSDT